MSDTETGWTPGPKAYRAEGNTIFKLPVRTDHGDGTSGISLGFPVADVHDHISVDGFDSAAGAVAELINWGTIGPELYEALVAAKSEVECHRCIGSGSITIGTGEQDECPDCHGHQTSLVKRINAALSKARNGDK